jgi:hypothetical protein
MPKESFSQFEKNPGEKPDEMPGETRQDISERIEKETKRGILNQITLLTKNHC